MQIFIKNNTVSDKIWVGQLIFPGAYYQLEENEPVTWFKNPTLLAAIVAEEAIISIDGTPAGDITDTTEQNNILQYPNTILLMDTATFFYAGTVSSRWLDHEGYYISGQYAGYRIPYSGYIKAITYNNQYSNSYCDVEIKKNNSTIHTIEIRNKKWKIESVGLESLTVDVGDYVGVYISNVSGQDPNDPIVKLTTIFNNESGTISEG